MSRSNRKTPIVGNATAASEKEDKRIWHKRMRSHERTSLSQISEEQGDNYIQPIVKDVSNVASMSKDGRHYWSEEDRIERAKETASLKGQTPDEKLAIKERLLRKWKSK